MLTSKLIGAKVFSIHAGHNVGTVKSWLIDLKDLKVSIITVELSDKALNYLLAGDIRSLGAGGKHMVIIDYEEKLSPKDDLIRHREMIDDGTSLMGYKVKTASGRYLGKLKDLSIDMQDLYVLKLHIRARAMARLVNERLMIDRTDILEINKSLITVKDSYAKTKQAVQKALPA